MQIALCKRRRVWYTLAVARLLPPHLFYIILSRFYKPHNQEEGTLMQTSYVIFTDSTGDLTPALIEQCEL